MRILIQAVRAVFVELLGVILVLWLLFGSVTWTLESAGVQRDPGTTPNLLATIKSSVTDYFPTRSSVTSRRTDDVGQRLEYYSRLYRRAASGYLRQVTRNLTNDLAPEHSPGGHAHRNTL